MTLTERIQEMLAPTGARGRGKKWDFTLEYGRGETYSNNQPTLYGHSEYERSSVLAGRPQRVFIDRWNTDEEALAAIETVKKAFGKKFKFQSMLDGGSTHIPVDQIVSHLPDDTDY